MRKASTKLETPAEAGRRMGDRLIEHNLTPFWKAEAARKAKAAAKAVGHDTGRPDGGCTKCGGYHGPEFFGLR